MSKAVWVFWGLPAVSAVVIAALVATGAGRPSFSKKTAPAQATPAPSPADRLKTAVSAQGEALAGRTMILHAVAVGPAPRSFRWIQASGAPVVLEDPTSATSRFTVPEGPGPLRFLLFVSDGQEVQSAAVVVPLPELPLRADAGEDQNTPVGGRITLDGRRGQPSEGVAFRWLPVSGPAPANPVESSGTYTFEAAEPGRYRFALVVARGTELSEPDFVEVAVEGPPAETPARVESVPNLSATPAAPASIAQVSADALAAMGAGPRVSESLANAFSEVGSRVDLYENYAELYAELARRLEPILPAGGPRRQMWNDRVFAPLTAFVVEGMRDDGLDLLQPEGLQTPLSDEQRERLAAQFREMAAGFRQRAAGH